MAPANAENRGQALPALRTRQMEAGLRYALPGGWRLNAAAFEIAKPYFDIDRRDGAYRQLGDVMHRGVEGSLSGAPFPGMSLVAGAVWLRPRVSGQAVADGRLGAKPIGRTSLLVDASADYRVAALPGFSIDGRVTVEGKRIANAANTLSLPARAVIHLGARYRTRVARTPVLVRADPQCHGQFRLESVERRRLHAAAGATRYPLADRGLLSGRGRPGRSPAPAFSRGSTRPSGRRAPGRPPRPSPARARPVRAAAPGRSAG